MKIDNISGKVVVITGASSGLGAAAAQRLGAHGAKLVLGARRVEKLESVAAEITKAGGQVRILRTDVADPKQVQALVDDAVASFGGLDVMINNAGLMAQSALGARRIEEWQRMIDINIKGVLYGIAAALPVMQAQKRGHIINVASVAGHKVHGGGAVYAATKHAVRVISEGLRQEVKPYNLRTTIISPGAVDTELPAGTQEPETAAGIKGFYESYAISADSFADSVLFAMSQPDTVDINEILYRPTAQEY